MPTLSPRAIPQKFLINGCLLVVLALLTGVIAAWYVSNEHYFYSWDFVAYQNWAIDLAFAFRDSKRWAIRQVLESLDSDYNLLFAIPLVPFILIFGDSRLVYILSLALVYLLPFSLVMGAVATKLISVHSRSVFWSTALLTLLLPPIWTPTLRGYPDTGGILIVVLAALAYLQDIRLQKRWQIPVIGFLLGVAMLFRRHFVYNSIAFLSAITLYALIAFFTEARQNLRTALHNLMEQGLRIGLIAATSLVTLTLVAWDWVSHILVTDYKALYAAYNQPFDIVFKYYASFYGWANWILVFLGFSAGIFTRVLALSPTIFICLFGIVSIGQWLTIIQYTCIHYSLHFAPLVVLGLASFIWTSAIILTRKQRRLILFLECLYIVSQPVIQLTPIFLFKRDSSALGNPSPPIIRSDYKVGLQMIEFLRKVAPKKEPIYVAASSLVLNEDIVRSAEGEFYGRKGSILNILGTAHVDRRDFYPLERLLQAQYVLVASPFQHHMAPKEQKVVKVVFDAFTQNWEIAKDFKRLPLEFTLEKNVVVTIYQRTRPTSLETALRTLQVMQQQIGRRPGSQLNWMMLSNLFPSWILQNSDKTYKITIHPSYRTRKPTISYIYIGRLPKQVEVTGKIDLPDKRCVGLALRFSMLSHEGQVLKVAEIVHSPGQPPNFALSLQNSNAAYLLMDVLSRDKTDQIDYCVAKLNNFSVSGKPSQ